MKTCHKAFSLVLPERRRVLPRALKPGLRPFCRGGKRKIQSMYLRKIGRHAAFALMVGYMIVVRAENGSAMWPVVGILALWAGCLVFELWKNRRNIGPAIGKLPEECAAMFAFRKIQHGARPYTSRRVLSMAARVFAGAMVLTSAAGLCFYWMGNGMRSATLDTVLAVSMAGLLSMRMAAKGRSVFFCRRLRRGHRIRE